MALSRRRLMQLSGAAALGAVGAAPARARADAAAGTHVPGELGVRHEDIVYVTEDGAANMTRWPGSPEDPAVV